MSGRRILSLDYISFSPSSGKAPLGLIIALHGWGADANDLAELTPYFNLPDFEFLFPDAPYPYPYSPQGKAWYDLRNENMFQGLTESRQMLAEWLLSLESSTRVPLSRTILCGFSQGGAMTLDVGLALPLAGLVSMSGYLHPGADQNIDVLPGMSQPKVLIMHGREDTVVPIQAAVEAKKALDFKGISVQYHEFDMGHEIRPEEMEVLRNFVLDAIA